MNSKFLFSLFAWAVTSFINVGAQSQSTSMMTVGHKLFEREFEGKTQHLQYRKAVTVLDRVLMKAYRELPSYSEAMTIEDAKNIFLQIDSMLYSEGFYICLTVQTFSDTFEEVRPQSASCSIPKVSLPHRLHFFNNSSLSYRLDCDLSSILYYSIGQRMGYPITMVAVPTHNFVRWNFPDGQYQNWDTNHATAYSDNDYRDGIAGKQFNATDESIMSFLTNMEEEEIIAYYLPYIGLKYKRLKQFSTAEAIYIEAISRATRFTDAGWFLAYLYLYNANYKDESYQLKAFNYAKEAYLLLKNLNPNDDTWLDIIETYACGCAAIGDFETAKTVVSSSANQVLKNGINSNLRCNQIFPGRDGRKEIDNKN